MVMNEKRKQCMDRNRGNMEQKWHWTHQVPSPLLLSGSPLNLCNSLLDSWLPSPQVLPLVKSFSMIQTESSFYNVNMGFLGGSAVKNLLAMQEPQETWFQSLGQEHPLEEGMASHSIYLPAESIDKGAW